MEQKGTWVVALFFQMMNGNQYRWALAFVLMGMCMLTSCKGERSQPEERADSSLSIAQEESTAALKANTIMESSFVFLTTTTNMKEVDQETVKTSASTMLVSETCSTTPKKKTTTKVESNKMTAFYGGTEPKSNAVQSKETKPQLHSTTTYGVSSQTSTDYMSPTVTTSVTQDSFGGIQLPDDEW